MSRRADATIATQMFRIPHLRSSGENLPCTLAMLVLMVGLAGASFILIQ